MTTGCDIDLTYAERATLRLAAQGYTQDEIGSMLHVSSEGVKSRLDRTRLKLAAITGQRVRNVTHACAIGITLDLI